MSISARDMMFYCVRDSVEVDRARLGELLVRFVEGQSVETQEIPALVRRISVAYEMLEDTQAYTQHYLENKYGTLLDLLVEGGCL